jgi:hypothetical protein
MTSSLRGNVPCGVVVEPFKVLHLPVTTNGVVCPYSERCVCERLRLYLRESRNKNKNGLVSKGHTTVVGFAIFKRKPF